MPRVLGLDPGEARIGVALSDPTGTIASPHTYIDVREGNAVDAINLICVEMEIETVVIGLPLRLDGSEGPAAERSRTLGKAVESVVGSDVDVRYWDERFTTLTAEDALIEGNVRRSKRKTTRDQIAAAVMLQGYLDRQAAEDR
ncbi:MAG: Holliday junction resolvase RuvX [Acidimicrobiia bacterium]